MFCTFWVYVIMDKCGIFVCVVVVFLIEDVELFLDVWDDDVVF